MQLADERRKRDTIKQKKRKKKLVMCVLSPFPFSILIFELSFSLYMYARCHRIDIIIEFPFSLFSLSALSNNIYRNRKKRKTDRQTEADRRPNAHACIYTYINAYVCKRDDDCHISDNVPRCSYNRRICIDTVTQMSKMVFYLHKKRCTIIFLY